MSLEGKAREPSSVSPCPPLATDESPQTPGPRCLIGVSERAHASNSPPNAVPAVLFFPKDADLGLLVDRLGLTTDLPVTASTALTSSFGMLFINLSSIRFSRRSSIAM